MFSVEVIWRSTGKPANGETFRLRDEPKARGPRCTWIA